MAKVLRHNAGRIQELATIQTSAGAADADKIPSLDAQGRLDASMMPTGIGADTANLQASEAIGAGDKINIHDVAGAFRMRRADAAAAGKEADGFVISAVASGASGLAYLEGRITGLSGLVPGARYYLSDSTPGGQTVTPPVGAGKVVQFLGKAVSATELNFEPDDGIVLV
jgi:hypothetical protein